MPKLNPERLTPASIATYVLDKDARARFHANHYYHITLQAKKPKKQQLTDEEKKAKRKETRKKANKKYREKMKNDDKMICQCGSELINRPWHIQRHYRSHCHQEYIKIHGDIIDDLD